MKDVNLAITIVLIILAFVGGAAMMNDASTKEICDEAKDKNVILYHCKDKYNAK